MRKQINPYKIPTLQLQSGERLPFIEDRQSGLPLFAPSIYILAELRARNLATASLLQAQRSVMVLQLILDGLEIDLDGRLRDGRLLELGEIEEIAQRARLPMAILVEAAIEKTQSQALAPALAAATKQRISKTKNVEVKKDSAAIRLFYILDYLKFRAVNQLLKIGPKHAQYHDLRIQADLVIGALRERIPGHAHRNSHARNGLSGTERARLLEVIDPNSEANPWTGAHARERNHLVVQWLLRLGIRRGELGGVRISDINFQKQEVFIKRRADDPLDPRRNQPNAKTRARLLALDQTLIEQTRRYINGARRAVVKNGQHDFLFVANGSGAPISLDAINKVFASLRVRVPNLPEDLSPHVLRHTWNDDFSALMDRQKIPETQEQKMRVRLQGWSPNSKMPATYTRRHIERRAREASLDLQKSMKGLQPDEAPKPINGRKAA